MRRFFGLRLVVLPIVFLFLLVSPCLAQETIVEGKVTDTNSGDPIPFVNVIFKGTLSGSTTDFDGRFKIKTTIPIDSITASYIGYKPRTKVVKRGITQVVNIQLEEDVTQLQEIVINAGENPAFEILRKVIRNKSSNDKRKLSAYEYDTYTKIEIDADHLTDEFRKRKVIQKITRVLDSIERIAGEDGKPILPIFITESVSKFYYRNNPSLRKELILKSKINGVGMEDGTMITQFIGSSFQEYNFYQNWLNIATKEFVSPIADGWRLYYEYDLTDSLFIGNDFCYRLDFFPKSEQDLAFKGTIWITKNEYALKQIDAGVSKQANLNFIEKIRIQQELGITEAGPWIPIKNRVLIDVGEISPNSAGMLAKFYTSNKNLVVDKSYDVAFYERPIEMAEDARMNEGDKYWDTLRHEPLSEAEKNVYRMIDTLRDIPVVKAYTDIIKAVVDGYIQYGKTEIGPYLGFVAWNNIEGLRLQFGFKTNLKFSKKWIYGWHAGYGFNDTRLKYMASAQHILSKEKWTTLSFRVRSDVARIGVDDEALADNPLFLAASRWGFFRRGYYFDEYRAAFQRELFKGFSQKISFRHWSFEPTYDFGYLEDPSDVSNSEVLETFQSSEVSI
ncbi:MAG: carboxypeptidase-like regulatory domain-containing protein, partial [Bacteroidia bacterium]|nr:carboxypeptidase-like regulatory domain-containing protein [Bacteroidia bacterium]